MSFDPTTAVLDETPAQPQKTVKFDPSTAVLDEKSTEPMVGAKIFGKVPLSAYQEGERNIVGNIFERPAAAVRSALQGKGYMAGAVNPGSVPTFQEIAIDKFAPKTQNVPVNFAGGLIPSALGFVADTLTSPAEMAGTLITSSLAPVVKATKAGQAISKFVNYPLENVPKALGNRGGMGVGMVLKRTPEQIVASADKQIDLAVRRGITKGIRPTVGGKQTASRNTQYLKKVRQGVEMIVANKDALSFADEAGNMVNRLPQSVNDYAQAIEQTKRTIFEAYTQMAQEAGDAGATFNASPVINKLASVSKDVKYNPQIRKYATDLINEVSELNGQSPLTIQERIKDLNQSLVSYYAGRVDKAKARLDASVANLLREELDGMIEKAQGEGYQALKNAFGSLKAAEKEVNHRAVVLSRANNKNIFDLTDIFTGGELISGALTGNPAQMAKGAGGYALKALYKRWNNPDLIIKNMFSDVDRIMSGSDAARKAIPQALRAEVVESVPVSAQAALPPAARPPLELPNMSNAGLPPARNNYGQGFVARPVGFSDMNRTNAPIVRYRQFLQGDPGKAFIEALWRESQKGK